MCEISGGGAARIAQYFIEDEAMNLSGIADDYAAAAKSGRFNNRSIKPEFAKYYAREFQARADALFIIAPLVAERLRCDSAGPTAIAQKDTPA